MLARGLLARFRVASRIAARRRLLTTPGLSGAYGSRKILVTWLVTGEVRRAVGLGALILDLVTLGLVRDVVSGRGGYGFGIAMSYDAERGELRFESYRRNGEDCRRPQDVVAATPTRGPLLLIIWDHGTMGHWVSPRLGKPGNGIWLGPDGQYRFDALLRLARSHNQLVWEALLFSERATGL